MFLLTNHVIPPVQRRAKRFARGSLPAESGQAAFPLPMARTTSLFGFAPFLTNSTRQLRQTPLRVDARGWSRAARWVNVCRIPTMTSMPSPISSCATDDARRTSPSTSGRTKSGRACRGGVRRARPRDGRVGRRETDDTSSAKRWLSQSPFSEMLLLSRCDHPNVVRLRAAYHDSAPAMSRGPRPRPGRTLVEYLIELRRSRRLDALARTSSPRKSILRQLVDAVAHLHSRDIVYRDLKPANVVVTRDPSPRAVLVDFGRAARLRRSERLNASPARHEPVPGARG